MENKEPTIEIDEVSLEDLIILGKDKLINISIKYPEIDENDLVKIVHTKAKIKQLTIKELRNLDINNINISTAVHILSKSLYKQDGTPFSKDLILALPAGVSFAIAREIMVISGVDEDKLGF